MMAYLQPDRIGRVIKNNLALRLVAVRKPEKAAAEARRKARRDAQREGYQISKATLAADWVILVTSLSPDEFSTEDVIALYRLRWRIELGFKRLKSLIGLKGPPGFDERSARPYVLVHLLVILLLEPLVDGLENSPPRAPPPDPTRRLARAQAARRNSSKPSSPNLPLHACADAKLRSPATSRVGATNPPRRRQG
jgi:hypothetical protein